MQIFNVKTLVKKCLFKRTGTPPPKIAYLCKISAYMQKIYKFYAKIKRYLYISVYVLSIYKVYLKYKFKWYIYACVRRLGLAKNCNNYKFIFIF